MTATPNLVRGSTGIDLRGVSAGTYPLELAGDSLCVDAGLDRVLEGFRFEGSLEWIPGSRRIRGTLRGRLRSSCDRCLVRFDRDVRTDVDVAVAPAGEPPAQDAGRGVEEVIGVSAADSTLDLAEAFRAAVLLEVPIKNVCRGDCRGLCPVCGADRNAASCDCEPPRGDPRWEALGGLSLPPNEE